MKLCVAAHRLVTPLLLSLLLVGWLPSSPVTAQEVPTPTPIDQGGAGAEVFGELEEFAPTATPEPAETMEATPVPVAPDESALPPPSVVETQPRQPVRVAVDVVAPSSVRAGQELTYTVLYTNTTGGPLNEVWLDVALSPIGTPPVQAYARTVDAPSQNPQFGNSEPITVTTNNQITNLQWRLGSVAPGANRIVFVVRVYFDRYPRSGSATTILGNTSKAYIGGRPGQGGSQDGSDNAGVLVVGPVFNLRKVAAPKDILAGQEVTYTMSLGNAAEARDQLNNRPRQDAITATNVVLFDRLAANVEFRRATPGFVFTPTNRLLSWAIPDQLLPGQTRTYTVVLRLASGASDCSSLSNSDIRVTSGEMPLRPSNGERIEIAGQGDSARIQDPVVVELTTSNARPFANEQSTVFINVKNFLPQTLTGISLTATSRTRAVAVDPASGQIDNTLNVVTWRNITLPPGSLTAPSNTRFAVTLAYGRNIGGQNTVVAVTVPPTPLPPSNIPIPQGCVRPKTIGIEVQPLIQLIKTVSKNRVQVGNEEFEYTLEVKNLSGQNVSELVLTDTLPNNNIALFVYRQTTAGPQPTLLDPRQTVLQWNNLSVAPRQSLFLKFRAVGYGSAGASACYNNQLSADSTQSQVRSISSATVCLDPPFEIEKTITPGAVDPSAVGDARNVIVTIRVRERYRPASVKTSPPVVFLKDDPQMNVTIGGRPSAADTELQFLRVLSYTNDTANLSDTAILETDGGVLWPEIPLNQVGDSFVVSMLFRVPGNRDQYQGRIFDNRACVGYRPSTWFAETSSPIDLTSEFNFCNFDDAITVLNRNTVRVNKTVDRQRAALGERVRYAIELRNDGPALVTGVSVSDTMPLNFRYDGVASGAPVPVLSTVGGQVNLRWNNLSIQSRQTLRIEFFARVPDFIGRYVNQAWADTTMTGANRPTFLCNIDNGDGCVYSAETLPIAAKHVPGVDVEQRITIEPTVNASTVRPGQLVTYTISLVSNNNIPYQNTTVTATLPTGFVYRNMLDNGAQPTQIGNQLVWKAITVPPAGQSNGTFRLRLVAQAATRVGVYRPRIEATSVTGTIPTSDRAATVIIGSDRPALSLTASPLAELGSVFPVAHAVINPDRTPLVVTTLTTTLQAGLEFAGMVVTNTVAPRITGTAASGQTLVWSNITVPASSGDDLGFVSLDFNVRAPQMQGRYAITGRATASRAIDTSSASVTVRVARLVRTYMAVLMNRR